MIANNEARKHVSGLLEKGVIEPSTSPWSSPICLVTKPKSDTNVHIETRMTRTSRTSELRNEILRELHCDVHFSFMKIWHKAKDKYWWPGMFNHIKDFCESCIQCQEGKGLQKRPPLIPIQSHFPWQIVGVDIMEIHSITKRGNRYVLVFVDLFTKYVVAKAIADVKAETVAKAFYEEIICRYGAPQKLLSDRGQQFLSKIMKFTRELFGVQGVFTASWNPRCDGMTEKSNQTIQNSLSYLVNRDHDDWDERLPTALFAYNTSPCFRSTDYTPYYLLFGRHAKGPSDLRLVIPDQVPKDIQDYVHNLVNNLDEAAETARDNIRANQAKMKEYFDKSAHRCVLQEGDKVFLYVHVTPKHLSRKLRHPWCGGFVIHKFLGPNTVRLRKLCDGQLVKSSINVKRLKKCIDPKFRPKPISVQDIFPDSDDLTEDDIPDDNFDPSHNNDDSDSNDSDSDSDDNQFKSYPKHTPQNTKAKSQNSKPEYFDIEKVLAQRRNKGELEFQVKWKGYSAKDNSWIL